MTVSRLSRAIRNSPFEGASGKVSFEENGDRKSTNMKYTVYDYKSGGVRQFINSGQVDVGGTFPNNTEHAIIFADGSKQVPNVKIPNAQQTEKIPKGVCNSNNLLQYLILFLT